MHYIVPDLCPVGRADPIAYSVLTGKIGSVDSTDKERREQCGNTPQEIAYSGVLSFVILKLVDAVVGLRVPEDEEGQGLDLTQHSEQGYNMEF